MTQQTELALNSLIPVESGGMKFIGRLTEIKSKLEWQQQPSGASVTGKIQLTFDVEETNSGTLQELKEWLRNRTA